MKVTVISNRRDPTRRLAFLQESTPRYGDISLPAYFDHSRPQPEEGEAEVMITSLLFHKDARGMFDRKRPPKCAFIRCIEPEDKFISHSGFECSGSMAQTLAMGKFEDGKSHVITPGRLHDYIPVAFNMNGANNSLRPGTGWVRINPANGKWRLEGVNSLKELSL